MYAKLAYSLENLYLLFVEKRKTFYLNLLVLLAVNFTKRHMKIDSL